MGSGRSAVRASHRSSWGDYLAARVLPSPDLGVLKILEDKGRFVINILLESETEAATPRFQTVLDRIFKQLLPLLKAENPSETSDYE